MKKLLITIICLFSILALSISAHAGTSDVTLLWDPPEIATDVAGYTVHYGTESRVYTMQADAGTALTYTITGLADGTYYFAVTAYNAAGYHSEFSNEVMVKLATIPPAAPKSLRTVTVTTRVEMQAGTITYTTTTGN